MFTSIGKKPLFYNKSIMDFSLKTTNDYIKKKIKENEHTKQVKFCIDNTKLKINFTSFIYILNKIYFFILDIFNLY